MRVVCNDLVWCTNHFITCGISGRFLFFKCISFEACDAACDGGVKQRGLYSGRRNLGASDVGRGIVSVGDARTRWK